MTIAEVKALLDAKLKGDKAVYELTEPLLKEAIFEVLRRTTPRTHIVYEKSDSYLFKYFRQTHFSYWLRYPYIDLSDDANLDMEEELAMAVVYFLASLFSVTKKESYFKSAVEIISIYDTNMNFRKNPRIFNCYLLKLDNSQPQSGNTTTAPQGGTTKPSTPTTIPILKNLIIEVGKSENILVDNSANNTITATSDNANIKVSVNGNIVTISSVGEVDEAYVTIKGGDDDAFKVMVFSAENDGGIID